MTTTMPGIRMLIPMRPKTLGRVSLIGIALNLLMVVLQLVYGIISNSIALVADAGHNFSDVLGLGVAFAGTVLAARAPSARFTYGSRARPFSAALFNAVFLLVVTGALGLEGDPNVSFIQSQSPPRQ